MDHVDVVGPEFFFQVAHDEKHLSGDVFAAEIDARLFQGADIGLDVLQVPKADCKVDDGLGVDGGNGCAPYMLDVHGDAAQEGLQHFDGFRCVCAPFRLVGENFGGSAFQSKFHRRSFRLFQGGSGVVVGKDLGVGPAFICRIGVGAGLAHAHAMAVAVGGKDQVVAADCYSKGVAADGVA